MTDLVVSRVTQALETLKLRAACAALERHLQAALERELSHLQFLDALLAD